MTINGSKERRNAILKAIGRSLLPLLIIAYLFNPGYQKVDKLKLEIIQNDEGFQYEIYQSEKMIIRQDVVPSIPGNKKFQTAEDALIVGRLVLEKLNNSESPSVTVSEIDSLGINID